MKGEIWLKSKISMEKFKNPTLKLFLRKKLLWFPIVFAESAVWLKKRGITAVLVLILPLDLLLSPNLRSFVSVLAFRPFHCRPCVSQGEEHTQCRPTQGTTCLYVEKQLQIGLECHKIQYCHHSQNDCLTLPNL